MKEMNKEKKILIWAGVLIAILGLIGVGSAGFVEHKFVSSVDDEDVDVEVLVYPTLSVSDENCLKARLCVFEGWYISQFGFDSEPGCNRIYDVNRDETINFMDAGLAWSYAVSPELHHPYGDLLYDVNMDGMVNFMDAGLIWVNRD